MKSILDGNRIQIPTGISIRKSPRQKRAAFTQAFTLLSLFLLFGFAALRAGADTTVHLYDGNGGSYPASQSSAYSFHDHHIYDPDGYILWNTDDSGNVYRLDGTLAGYLVMTP